MDLSGSLFGKDITIHAFGVNSGTSILNLNDFAVNQSLPVFFGTAGFKLDITSSDNTKDVAAGTGARKIKVYGLDANLRPLVEEIALNGKHAGHHGRYFPPRVRRLRLSCGNGRGAGRRHLRHQDWIEHVGGRGTEHTHRGERLLQDPHRQRIGLLGLLDGPC